MAEPVSKMSFAHLRQSDYESLERMLSDHRLRNNVVASLIEYLRMWSQSQWVDEEALYLLGRDLNQICPASFRNPLRRAVATAVSDKIANGFLAGFDRPSLPLRQDRPPSPAQLKATIFRARANPGPDAETQLSELISRYAAYATAKGNIGPLINAITLTCSELVRIRGPARTWAALYTQRIAREGLDYAPENERLWNFWAAALAQQGAFDAAELVYWEALLRFSWSSRIRHRLILILKRRPHRSREALELAEESYELFPESGLIGVQLALLLAEIGDEKDISRAIEILIRQLQAKTHPAHELSPLAYILNLADQKRALTDVHLMSVVTGLRRAIHLLNPISRRLTKELGAFSVAQRLWRLRVAVAPDDTVARSQLAGSYIDTGTTEDLESAISILRDANTKFPKHQVLMNHLAKALALGGSPDQRAEAMEWLNQAMAIDDTDIYSRNQLAELLIDSENENDRQRGAELLERTREIDPTDRFSLELLSRLKSDRTGRTPESEELPVVAGGARADFAVEDEDDLDILTETAIDPADMVPRAILKRAEVRHLRFRLQHGSANDKIEATNRVKAILEDNPSFGYAQIIATRLGFERDQSAGIANFAISFERALRDRDEQLLDLLGERFPKLAALTTLARAMFGDIASAARIENLLSMSDETLHPAVRALKRRLRPHLALVSDQRERHIAFTRNEMRIREALYDSNETNAYEPSIAA